MKTLFYVMAGLAAFHYTVVNGLFSPNFWIEVISNELWWLNPGLWIIAAISVCHYFLKNVVSCPEKWTQRITKFVDKMES